MLDVNQLAGFVEVKFSSYGKSYIYGIPLSMKEKEHALEDLVVVPNGLYATDTIKHKPYTIGYATEWIDLDSYKGQQIRCSMNNITMIAGYVYANTYKPCSLWSVDNFDAMWDSMTQTEQKTLLHKVIQKSFDF